MLGLLALTCLAMGAMFAISDSDDEPSEDTGCTECEGDYDDWEGSDVRVTPDGGVASFVAAPGGTDADELIETNITDNIFQYINSGEGLDEVRIGLGDWVDTRIETVDHGRSSLYGDDLPEEQGDHVVVTLGCDDLENATQLGTEYSDVLDIYRVEEISGSMPVFQAELGSGDTLEICIPDSEDGALFVLEGEEHFRGGSGDTRYEYEHDYALILYSPDGSPPPDGLRTDENVMYYNRESGPLEESDLEGLYVIGRLDLGTSYYEEDQSTGEFESWDETVALPSIALA